MYIEQNCEMMYKVTFVMAQGIKCLHLMVLLLVETICDLLLK